MRARPGKDFLSEPVYCTAHKTRRSGKKTGGIGENIRQKSKKSLENRALARKVIICTHKGNCQNGPRDHPSRWFLWEWVLPQCQGYRWRSSLGQDLRSLWTLSLMVFVFTVIESIIWALGCPLQKKGPGTNSVIYIWMHSCQCGCQPAIRLTTCQPFVSVGAFVRSSRWSWCCQSMMSFIIIRIPIYSVSQEPHHSKGHISRLLQPSVSQLVAVGCLDLEQEGSGLFQQSSCPSMKQCIGTEESSVRSGQYGWRVSLWSDLWRWREKNKLKKCQVKLSLGERPLASARALRWNSTWEINAWE